MSSLIAALDLLDDVSHDPSLPALIALEDAMAGVAAESVAAGWRDENPAPPRHLVLDRSGRVVAYARARRRPAQANAPPRGSDDPAAAHPQPPLLPRAA